MFLSHIKGVNYMLVAIVGVCASGKSTLVKNLRDFGIDAYNVAQEHSCIKKFWQRRKPDVVIMIDVTLEAIRKRRNVSWDEQRLIVQHERLEDAKQNADLYIQTDLLSKEMVVQKVLDFIRRKENAENNNRNA